MEYLVVYEQSNNGWGAYAPDLPGRIAAGATLEETKTLMRDAIVMHVKLLTETGQHVPASTSMGELVSIAA